MTVEWIQQAESPNYLNDWVASHGWSNQTAIACKAGWHLKNRFPDTWARETECANHDPANRRIEFGQSRYLPHGFEMEIAMTVNGEVVQSDAPLLLRELRGLMVVDGQPKTINSFDMDGQFDPRRSESDYWDRCYGERVTRDLDCPGESDKFPEGAHFGLCQVDSQLNFSVVNVGADKLLPDCLVIYMRPTVYVWPSQKMPRFGKSLTFAMVHIVDEFVNLEEWLHIVYHQDFGPLRSGGSSRGVARYYRKYSNVRARHYLEVGFRMDEDWILRPMPGQERNGVVRGGGPEPPDKSYADRHDRDLMRAYGGIYQAYERVSAHDICGPRIMSNPPAQILDLLTAKR